MSSFLRVVPPELTSAAAPLDRASVLLRELSDDRRGLEGFADGTPNERVRDALRTFVERWELVLWEVGGNAGTLATILRFAAEDYQGTDEQIAHDLALKRGGSPP